MTTIARQVVHEAVRAAMARRPRVLVSEWADRERRIVAQDAGEPGRWRTDRTPYLRGPMDAFNDRAIRQISVKKAERRGGTEAILNIGGYIIDHDPGPVLWVYPTIADAQEINRKKVLPTMRGTPAIARHRTGRAWDERTTDLQFDRMSIAFRGSNSESGLEAMGYKTVIVDELDRCAPDVLDVVAGRGTANPGFKLIVVSTPEVEWSGDAEDKTQGIDRCFREGDQRRVFVPCPRCGEYHRRTFKRVRWIGDLKSKPEEVEKGAYFICPNAKCGEIIHGHHNQEQLARCIWVPEGWHARPDGEVISPKGDVIDRTKTVGGQYYSIVGAEARGGDHASFHIHGLINPFSPNPYGSLAKEFVKNSGQVTREWLNRRMGEADATGGQGVKASELDVLRGLPNKVSVSMHVEGDSQMPGASPPGTPHQAKDLARPRVVEWRMGTVPGEVQVLTAYCDVQAACMWVEVIGWNFGQLTRGGNGVWGFVGPERRWLVDWINLPRSVDDKLEHLSPVALRTWPVVDLLTGELKRERPLAILGVDSGKYATTEIYDFVRPRQAGHWSVKDGRRVGAQVVGTKGIPGMAGQRGAEPHRKTTPEKDLVSGPGGRMTPIPGAVELILINTWHYKAEVYAMLTAEIARARRVRREEAETIARALGTVIPPPEEDAGLVGEHLTRGMGETEIGDGQGPRRCFFPDDTPKDYFDQLTAEDFRTPIRKGVRVKEWFVRPGHASGNHALDCRVGNECIVKALAVRQRYLAELVKGMVKK